MVRREWVRKSHRIYFFFLLTFIFRVCPKEGKTDPPPHSGTLDPCYENGFPDVLGPSEQKTNWLNLPAISFFVSVLEFELFLHNVLSDISLPWQPLPLPGGRQPAVPTRLVRHRPEVGGVQQSRSVQNKVAHKSFSASKIDSRSFHI